MINNQITEALRNLVPDAEWSLIGDNYEDLVWYSDGNKPTKTQISTEIANLEAKKLAKEQELIALKASAKAKLISGQPLTSAEADTLVI